MPNIHPPHGSKPPRREDDEALRHALQQVATPEDLEARILSRLESQQARPSAHPAPTTRRGWLAASLALGCGGVAAGGLYAWQRRPLRPSELRAAVQQSLTQRNWSLYWKPLPPARTVQGIPFPSQLQIARGWQPRNLGSEGQAIAYDVTVAGCKAVLFACQTKRELVDFPAMPLGSAFVYPSLRWRSFSIWQQNQQFAYALAVQGGLTEYRLRVRDRRPATLA